MGFSAPYRDVPFQLHVRPWQLAATQVPECHRRRQPFSVQTVASQLPGLRPRLGVQRWPGVSSRDNRRQEGCGVSEEMRKVGASLIPEVTIATSDGQHFKITTVTTFANVVIEFNLGEEKELTTADGRKTKNVYSLEGNTLKQAETPADGSGPSATYERILQDDGNIKMVMTTGSTVAKRLYRKI